MVPSFLKFLLLLYYLSFHSGLFGSLYLSECVGLSDAVLHGRAVAGVSFLSFFFSLFGVQHSAYRESRTSMEGV